MIQYIFACGLFLLLVSGCSNAPQKSDKENNDTEYREGKAYDFDLNLTAENPHAKTRFSPYVDMTAWPFFDFNKTNNLTHNYTLAFINSAGECSARWGNFDEYDMEAFRERIVPLKALGGHLTLSFGGAAAGTNALASVCADAEALHAAYKDVIEAYGIHSLDFDIEGSMLEDLSALQKRFDALALLQKEYEDLHVTLTLPVMPEGLTVTERSLIQQAFESNVTLDGVNLMLMDYSEEYPADNATKLQMFGYSKAALEAVNEQLKTFLPARYRDATGNVYGFLGAVAMIGQNDVDNEIMFRSDFSKLRDYAIEHGIGLLSFWALNRDKMECSACSVEDSTMLKPDLYGKEAFSFTKIGAIANITQPTSQWIPPYSWYWQLSDAIVEDVPAKIYDVDLFDVNTSTIASLHEQGKEVICYFSAGSYEEWREDAKLFPQRVIGKALDGWEGEKWLDIRDAEVRKIMKQRLDLAVRKGCDAVEADNVDGFDNETGFELTYYDQLYFNEFLNVESRRRGLLSGLKNDGLQVDELVHFFDFSLNESCHELHSCRYYTPFIYMQKPALNAEYDDTYIKDEDAFSKLCETAQSEGFSTIVVPLELDGSFIKSCLFGTIQ